MSAARRSSRAGRIELAIGLLVLAAIVGVGVGLAVARHTPVEPGLVIESKELDFGTVWEQPAFRHAVTLANPTGKPVNVAEIQTGCGCTTVQPQSFTVAPGKTQELTATLDLTGYGGKPFSVELLPTLAHQPPGDRTVWTLQGRVRTNPIELSEPSIDFGEEVIQGEPSLERGIKVSLPADSLFTHLKSHIVAGEGQAELDPLDKGHWRLRVASREDLPTGPFTFTVRIEPAGTSGKPLPFRDVEVRGGVRDDLAAWPRTVNFGVLELGETGQEYLVLASHRGRPFEVMRIETPEGVTVAPAEEQLDDGSRTFVVEQTAAEQGDRKSEVVFHVRRERPETDQSEEFSLPVPVSYYGTRAEER